MLLIGNGSVDAENHPLRRMECPPPWSRVRTLSSQGNCPKNFKFYTESWDTKIHKKKHKIIKNHENHEKFRFWHQNLKKTTLDRPGGLQAALGDLGAAPGALAALGPAGRLGPQVGGLWYFRWTSVGWPLFWLSLDFRWTSVGVPCFSFKNVVL